MSEDLWLERARRDHRGYWIGTYRQGDDWSHALVGYGDRLVHNPTRGISATRGFFGELHTVHVLTAADPAKIARRLGPELLPDVAGALEREDRRLHLAAEIAVHRPRTMEELRTA